MDKSYIRGLTVADPSSPGRNAEKIADENF